MDTAQGFWPARADDDLVRRVRAFVAETIVPAAHEIDERDLYPTEIVRQLAALGCNTICLPTRYGGGGAPHAAAASVCEEVGYGSAAVAISLITIFQAQTIIHLFGSDSLKDRYLPRFAQGLIASYALTEASHGSDIRTLDTKARREGESWILDGEKSFITSGSQAEFFVILAETETGVSAFAVPRESPGLSSYIGHNSATFGLRNGPHVNIRLEGVRLPLDHLIGQDGKGVRQAVTTLDYSRTLAAAISIGIARAAFDAALAHTRSRVAFDRTVIEFQGIQWYFADMLARIDAARLLVYRAAEALDAPDHADILRTASAAKLVAAEVATEVASKAVQVCGAYGTMVNAPFNRFFRDAKTYEIGGGSTEVLRNTLAKYIVKQAAAS
ncbi:acyl-CoA dehydrogenase family protein (plasmid) [Methylobacterium currus]|uniref:acyl-CoA dehydrogenase family protein n=1 Tax=Methylobacterium currus TaxID=2051553 RepID=UPI001E56AA6F|nr:acyl-CoA dehydrogenase family protein [Methylobacterium currus]UHC19858.1 acyl-CoA dehydrogenase family protein [Methylobacterium currus]